jgi:hypothetical protein
MKAFKVSSVAALFSTALILTSCSDTPNPTTPEVNPDFGATVETFLKGRFPIGPRSQFNVCTNEWVDIVGEYNLIVRQVTTPSGRTVFQIHSVAAHVNGVGQTSGDTYVSNDHFNYVERSGGDTYGLVIESTIVRVAKGEGSNDWGKFQIFVVVNANGELVVDRFDIAEKCTGAGS